MNNQHGFVLVLALLFLVLISMLTIGLLNTSLLEKKMAFSFQKSLLSPL